jgi:hypothetical protein
MEKEIKITVKAPCECTDEQYKEWVEFCLGYRGGMKMSNPLHEYDLEATEVEIN